MKNSEFKSFDGKLIAEYRWETENPRAVVQIIHGMAEHMGRYARFAEMLAANGYTVAGLDHRGHGKTAGSREKMGLTEGRDIFTENLKDALAFSERLESDYGVPLIVLGHSYGSFILQRYMQEKKSGVKAYVLMGSAYQKGMLLTVAKMLANMRKGKPDSDGSVFASLTFESYDKKLREGKNSWLTRDKEIVDKYNADAYCNKTLSNGFYRCMFRGIGSIYNKELIKNAPKDVPVLVVSGGSDGVGGYGKLVKKLHLHLLAAGYNAELKLYEGARHEILNETNRQEVYDFLLAFFDKYTAKKV